ncbi:chaplin [Streptomyces bungoensis]|uniref:chaplin n=1 Tax=Streptomyces bungoensis TaxID=285568 RepID=UPI003442B303
MIAVAAASGAMAVAMPVSGAFAADGAGAAGSAAGSAGLLSGNTIQLPVHVPVNVCGNTVNVVGLLNPAAGNTCRNGHDAAGQGGSATSGTASAGTPAGSSAQGAAEDSPGLLSGNTIQLPVHAPVNVTGNSVNVVGVGNPAVGNHSENVSGDEPSAPVTRAPKPPAPVEAHPAPRTPQAPVASLAHTGADMTAPAIAGSAALVLTGATLYRRFRPGRTR